MLSLVSRAAMTCLGVIAIVTASSTAHADLRSSAQWFAAKSEKERIILQGMLVLLGHYNGLIDGVFGKNTYQSIVSFEQSSAFDTDGVLSPIEERKLISDAVSVYDSLGFSEETDARTGLRIPIPTRLFARSSPSKWGTLWESADGSIELETLAIPESETAYATLFKRLSSAGDRSIEYSFFRDSTFILSGRLGVRRFYTAFVRSSGSSHGFSISWSESKDKIASVVSVFLASTAEFPDAASFSVEAERIPLDEPRPRGDFAGSGFSISTEGTVVTNAHVVEDCKAIEVAKLGPARIVASDADRDLAVIQMTSGRTMKAASIQRQAPELGQAIVVLGYPLSDLMGNALTVSPGVVGSLSGLGGDKTSFTVAASIQPGNSGGPVLDLNGNVVGVAVSKFNEARLLSAAGTTGANLGFAINAETLLDFLGPFKFEVTASVTTEELSVQAVVAAAKGFTHQIICRN